MHDGGSCPYSGGGSSDEGNSGGNSSAATSTPKTPVAKPMPKKETVKIINAPKEMKIGSNQGFTYSVENGTSSTVKVESNNTNVIVINEDQTLKAVGIGEATITVSSEKATEMFTVVVKPVEVEAIEVDEETVRLEIGETGQILAEVAPGDATDKTLKWSSTDENIVTVSNGKLVSKQEGEATIVIEASNGIKRQVLVEVYCVEVENIKIDDSKTEYLEKNVVDIEGSIKLEAVVSPENATYPEITWTTSDEKVVAVKDGEFEIIGEGKVVLTATAKNGVFKEIELEIRDDSMSAAGTVGTLAVLGVIAGVVWKKRKKKK